jgi:integrase
MAIKGQRTTSDFLEWDSMLLLVQKLQKNDPKLALLIQTASYTGLRVSDLLKLKWYDVFDKDYIELVEKKTSKYRKIKINDALKNMLKNYSINAEIDNTNQYIFLNRFKTKPISIQYINRKLKRIKTDYRLNLGNISMHTFRKTFGRKVVESSSFKEKSLIILSELFNHSSTKMTKIYLGLRSQELMQVYDLL